MNYWHNMVFSFIDTHLYIEHVWQKHLNHTNLSIWEIYGEKLIPRDREKFGALDAVTLWRVAFSPSVGWWHSWLIMEAHILGLINCEGSSCSTCKCVRSSLSADFTQQQGGSQPVQSLMTAVWRALRRTRRTYKNAKHYQKHFKKLCCCQHSVHYDLCY